MRFIFKYYQRFIYHYPITSQSIQTGLLCGTGDIIAQTFVENKSLKEVNYKRTARFAIIGTVMIGPSLTVWYTFLSKRFPTAISTTTATASTASRLSHKNNNSALFKKVALDQLVFAPSFLAIFLCTMHLLQGKTVQNVQHEVKDKYIDVLLTNYKIWPLVQLCNFYFVPLTYQVLLVQVVAIFWNAYLSHTTK